MKKIFVKIYYFFKSEKAIKNIIEIIFYVLVTLIISLLMPGNLSATVISTIIGFVLSTFLIKIINLLFGSLEDKIKVSGDTSELLKLYNADPSYKKIVELNGTKNTFIYHEIFVNDGKHKFEVIDDKDKYFELTGLIENNFTDLYSIHSRSTKSNEDTIRLDSVKVLDDKVVFYTSRSNFYNHLVTNRAIDYKIVDNLRLRDIYEHGPYIGSLENSKLSNHVGINALVFLNNNLLLIPCRAGDSTISKKCATASIAAKLHFPKDCSNHIDSKFLFNDAIIDDLGSRLKIDLTKLDLNKVHIEFLGVGQNIYEGGKPQTYFCVNLDYDIEGYMNLLQDKKKQSAIDKDSCIYIANFNSLRFFSKELLRFSSINQVVYRKKDGVVKPVLKKNINKSKEKEVTLGYEKSYMLNLWHYLNKIEK